MECQLCAQMSVWHQGYHNNVCHVVWMSCLTMDRSLHFFWYFYCWLWILFVHWECYLMTYLCGKPKWGCINGSSWKPSVSNSAHDQGVFQRYLSISCYDNVIFNFCYFILGKLVQSHSWNLKMVFLTYYFISLLTLSKFSQCFKVLNIENIETVF